MPDGKVTPPCYGVPPWELVKRSGDRPRVHPGARLRRTNLGAAGIGFGGENGRTGRVGAAAAISIDQYRELAIRIDDRLGAGARFGTLLQAAALRLDSLRIEQRRLLIQAGVADESRTRVTRPWRTFDYQPFKEARMRDREVVQTWCSRLRGGLLVPAGCLALQLLASATNLVAQTPSPPKVFYACYVKVVGAVYRIKEPGIPQNCLTGHVQFSWTDGTAGGDHGLLTGLLDDDHPQYLRTDGTRALTGTMSAGGFTLSNLAAATAAGEAVRFEQAVKAGDSAGGDLSGTFPNASVVRLQGTDVAATSPTTGQVLTFNGTAWAPATGGSGGGVTDHGALAGLTDDDHPQYLLAEGVRVTNNGFAVTGTSGSGAYPTLGPGVRMMWAPAFAAFRAGEVDGPEWDLLGMHSFAAGHNTRALGQAAVALGEGTNASGSFSTAMGDHSIASAQSATALGDRSNASGLAATAIGRLSTASGQSSVAMGEEALASGDYALASGYRAGATGTGATALGFMAYATGANSTAVGHLASTGGHDGAVVFSDASTGLSSFFEAVADNEFAVRAVGGFRFRTAVDLLTGCNLPARSGAFACTSSRITKHHFAPLDPEDVLRKIAGLSIQSWSYKNEAGDARHAGPVAEDFHAAFGLGTDSTSIGLIDEAGISLIGIQALEARTTALKRENEALRAAVARLEALVSALRDSR